MIKLYPALKAISILCLMLLGACGIKKNLSLLRPEPRITLASAEMVENNEALSGSYIVAFKSHLDLKDFHNKSYKTEYRNHFLKLELLDKFSEGVKGIHYLTGINFSDPFYSPRFDPKGPTSIRLFWEGRPDKDELASIVRVDFASHEIAKERLEEWEEQGLIYYAEPNYLSTSSETKSLATYKETYAAILGEDKEGSLKDGTTSPWMTRVKLEEAYEALSNLNVDISNPPLIAILDSGIDYSHPSLAEKIWKNTAVGQLGCVDDNFGCNTTKSYKGALGNGDVFPAFAEAPGTACPTEDPSLLGICVHGTHTAGLIAAEPDTGKKFGGACPMCQLVPVRIVGPTITEEKSLTSIADSSIIAGLTYVSRQQFDGNVNAIRIISASFGKFQRSRTVEHIIRLMKNNGKGILVIAAAGNEDTQKRQYPAAFNDTLSVVNIRSDNMVKDLSSNFGVWTNISAPGSGPCDASSGLRSTIPGGGVLCLQGTSMATPVVAGIAGLILLANPNISAGELADRIINTSDPVIYDSVGNAVYYPEILGEPSPVALLGAGLINAANAITNTPSSGSRPKIISKRVTNICGTLQGSISYDYNASYSILILLALPLLIGIFPYFKRQK